MKLSGRSNILYAYGDGFLSLSISRREMVYISSGGDKHYILGPEPSGIGFASTELGGLELDPSINESAG